jgi:hypothetical protein
VLGESAKAEQLLAALGDLCPIPCEEYDDLKRAIAAYRRLATRWDQIGRRKSAFSKRCKIPHRPPRLTNAENLKAQ